MCQWSSEVVEVKLPFKCHKNVRVSICLLMSLVTTKIDVLYGDVYRLHFLFLSFSLKTGM